MTDPRAIYKARVDAAIVFIEEHLAEDLDLKDLAQAAHFSAFHFHRIFSAVVGETPQQFLNRVRLERAANMLVKNPAHSITQIALTCGFSSPATFARSFKKHFGMAASQYRKAEHRLMPPGIFPVEQDQNELPQFTVEVRNVPAWNLAYISNLRGYCPDLIYPAWDQLFRWAAARDLVTEETRALGISLDDPLITPPEKCRYYACLTLPDEITPQPPIGFMKLAGSKCAVAHVTCTAEQIQGVFTYIYRHWLVSSGYQPADLPPYEVYQVTSETNPEGKFILDVHIPIVPL
jgi:AraC family transcriptional regulator